MFRGICRRLMGRRTPRAHVAAEGRTGIRIIEPDGRETVIDIAGADWIGFVNIGEDFLSLVDEGWWLIGGSGGAVAINVDCPAIDLLMRDGPLAAVIDRVPRRIRIDLDSRPRVLRGRDALAGIVHLGTAAAAQLLATGTQSDVVSVRDFPRIA